MIVNTYRGIPFTLPPVIDILVSFPLIEVNFRFDVVHTCLHNRFIRTHTHTHSIFFSFHANIRFFPRTRFYQAYHLILGRP